MGIVDLRRVAVGFSLNESGNGQARLTGNRAKSPISDKKGAILSSPVRARCVMVMT